MWLNLNNCSLSAFQHYFPSTVGITLSYLSDINKQNESDFSCCQQQILLFMETLTIYWFVLLLFDPVTKISESLAKYACFTSAIWFSYYTQSSKHCNKLCGALILQDICYQIILHAFIQVTAMFINLTIFSAKTMNKKNKSFFVRTKQHNQITCRIKRIECYLCSDCRISFN